MIIFQHLAKTGGTTLGSILNNIVPRPQQLPVTHRSRQTALGTWSHEDVANSLCSQDVGDIARAFLVAGHVGFGAHEVLPRPAKYITIVRDPVERVLSGYYYSIPVHERETGEHVSLEDYVFRKRHYDLGLDNYQCRVLSGSRELDPFGPVTTEYAREFISRDFELVQQNLRDFYVMIGLTERFDELVVALAHLLGASLTDVVYHRQNVTPSRPPRRYIARKTLAEIKRRNRWDLRLYKRCAKFFQQTIASFGPGFCQEIALFKRLNGMYQAGVELERLRHEEQRNRRVVVSIAPDWIRKLLPWVGRSLTLPKALAASFVPLRCDRAA